MATNVNFSLSPGMATTNIIDYTTTAGQKLWNNATDKLSVELFDCESEGLRDFLELIRARSEVMGWSLSVLSIPVDVNDNLETHRTSSVTTMERSIWDIVGNTLLPTITNKLEQLKTA
jgi:hypothetical protein